MATTRPPLKGNMLIAQSGGPTAVINQSLVGAVLAARKSAPITGVFGARHGIQGILEPDFVDLGRESVRTLEQVARTPSSMLGSVRKKPTRNDCVRLFDVMQNYQVRYFFYIGGNDSAETAHIINEEAKNERYEFRCFHIPKTIDNDLRENDHTPGFGSAARFVASAFMGDTLDNRALGGVKINIVMGRHAGFLTAASALARVHPDDGPHLIYLPERPFSLVSFARDVKAVLKRLGRCVVAVSEGIVDARGRPIVQRYLNETDAHGNVQLSGTGALGDLLADELRRRIAVKRVRADTFGYLQRSFAGVYSETDAKEAREVGRLAVQYATGAHRDGSVAIKRVAGSRYQVKYQRVALKRVARETRHMPDRFIASSGHDVTNAFLKYAAPLAGPLPEIGRLKGHPVPPVG